MISSESVTSWRWLPCWSAWPRGSRRRAVGTGSGPVVAIGAQEWQGLGDPGWNGVVVGGGGRDDGSRLWGVVPGVDDRELLGLVDDPGVPERKQNLGDD